MISALKKDEKQIVTKYLRWGKEDCMNKMREGKNTWHIKGTRQQMYKVYEYRDIYPAREYYTTPFYPLPSSSVENIS